MNHRRSPGRDGNPINLKPLDGDDALRRAMQVPAPTSDPKPPKSKPAKKQAKAKKT